MGPIAQMVRRLRMITGSRYMMGLLFTLLEMIICNVVCVSEAI